MNRFQKQFLSALKHDRVTIIAGAISLILILLAIIAPSIAPYDPKEQLSNGLDQFAMPLPPSANHLAGTDFLGRDVLSRLLYGARVSLAVGIGANGLAIIIGALIGLIAGYFEGFIGDLLMRFTDLMMAFPFILFVIALVAILGPGLENLFIAIGLVTWVNTARIIRANTIILKKSLFVTASQSLGATDFRIIFRHIIPNLFNQILVLMTLGISYTILLEASLSYLGLGVQPPTASWGVMVREAQAYYRAAPWLMFYPGLAIALAVVSFNLLGDGLGDLLDPTLD